MYKLLHKATNEYYKKNVEESNGNKTQAIAMFSNKDKALHFMRNKKLNKNDYILKYEDTKTFAMK